MIHAAPNHRPNVLILVTDDQNYDEMRTMPMTRRWLGEGGVRFTNAYVTTPQCCPSRASILTGRYAHNHGVENNRDASNIAAASLLPRYLKGAGYRTGLFGKLFNSSPIDKPPPYFDRYAFTVNATKYTGQLFNVQGKLRIVDQYNSEFIGNRAVDFLNGAESHDGKPWFMYVAPTAPHTPFTSEPRFRSADVPGFHPDPAQREKNLSDKPGYVRTYKHTPLATFGQRFRDQERTLESIDAMLGRIRVHLADLHEGNTMVVFISDNGLLLGDHGLQAKDSPYLPDVHVPMYMRWPGHMTAGSTDDRLVANIDIAPTILGAARVSRDPRYPMDGMDLLDGSNRRSRLLLEFWNSGSEAAKFVPDWASELSKTHQYSEYYDGAGRVAFREYYDLRRDPVQLKNLLGDGNLGNDPTDVHRLAIRLASDRRCSGHTCP